MGKLFNLKEWLTVSDAARHLTILFGEAVTPADVLRLGLDGRLRLSVHLVNHAQARCGKVVGYEELEWEEFPAELVGDIQGLSEEDQGKKLFQTMGLNIEDQRYLNLDDEVITLRGVWDLPMIGSERLDIENEYQRLTYGPDVTLESMDGAFVEGRDGQICQLQENFRAGYDQVDASTAQANFEQSIAKMNLPANAIESAMRVRKELWGKDQFFPAGGLPKDAVIVVRTSALREFEEAIDEEPTDSKKSASTTERKTLLTIIAALCDYSDINYQERGAANKIANLTEELGAAVSDDTVRRWVRRIPDALESRTK